MARRHLDRGQDPRGHSDLLDRVLQGESVDHGGEHAHVVAGGTVHAPGAGRDAPEDIPPADHDRQLDAESHHLADLGGNPSEDIGIDAKAVPAREHLAGELEEDAAIGGAAVRH
jgi:hypothetical protein